MRRLSILLSLCITVLALGCGKPEDKHVGTYSGEIRHDDATVEDILRDMSDDEKLEARQELEVFSQVLSLDTDGKYTKTTVTAEGSQTVTGTWEVWPDGIRLWLSSPGEIVTLTPMLEAIGMRNFARESLFDISEDGNELSFEFEDFDPKVKFVFVKDS